jgi:3-oxoacyl-[acyl-carrier protein] reductase
MSTESGTRVAIVTGGSRGIGRAVVRLLAARGHAIVVGYTANAAEAEAAVADAAAAGAKAVAVQSDVTDETAVAAMFDEAEAQFGGVDVVVNSAGRMAESTIAELDLEELDSLYRVNVRGAFAVAQQAARRVRAGGSIVLFSSSLVGLYFPTYGAYTAGKSAVEALTRVLARELRGRDVTVNAVAPGPTVTDMLLDGRSEDELAGLAAANPLERLGEPSDIAEVTAFLASSEGHWVNGQILNANGGMI